MASGLTEGNSLACNAGNSNKPLFMDVNADEELETTEVESLCMQCGKSVRLTIITCSIVASRVQGVTRLMLTKIPMFREVILMSFSCPHCNASNNEIQPGAPLQDKGVRYSFRVQQPQVSYQPGLYLCICIGNFRISIDKWLNQIQLHFPFQNLNSK